MISELQRFDYQKPWGTTYHKGFLCCVGDNFLVVHTISSTGLLTEYCRLDMGFRLLYLSSDNNYLYVVKYSDGKLYAVELDVAGVTLTQVGNYYSSTGVMSANSDGYVYVTNNQNIKKLQFDGINFNVLADNGDSGSSSVYAIKASSNYVVRGVHAWGSSTFQIYDAGTLSLLSSKNLDAPDGVYTNNNIAAAADDTRLYAYDLRTTGYPLLGSVSLGISDQVADNIDYDADGNFFVYLVDSIQQVYFDTTGVLKLGDKLTLSGASDGRINWQASTYVARVNCFYITRQTAGFYVVKNSSTGFDPTKKMFIGINIDSGEIISLQQNINKRSGYDRAVITDRISSAEAMTVIETTNSLLSETTTNQASTFTITAGNLTLTASGSQLTGPYKIAEQEGYEVSNSAFIVESGIELLQGVKT